jgi:single-strand DNA-binding protein
MQRFECIARITKDIELVTTSSGVSKANFSVAVDRKFRNANGEKETDFFNVVAWRGLGETISKFCKKGSKIFIAGEVQNRSYNKADGTKAYITEIIASECEFLDNKKKDDEESNNTGFEPIDLDTLPF